MIESFAAMAKDNELLEQGVRSSESTQRRLNANRAQTRNSEKSLLFWSTKDPAEAGSGEVGPRLLFV